MGKKVKKLKKVAEPTQKVHTFVCSARRSGKTGLETCVIKWFQSGRVREDTPLVGGRKQ